MGRTNGCCHFLSLDFDRATSTMRYVLALRICVDPGAYVSIIRDGGAFMLSDLLPDLVSIPGPFGEKHRVGEKHCVVERLQVAPSPFASEASIDKAEKAGSR